MEAGTEITLSTATSGAQIYYTLDDSDPTSSATREAYSDDNKPVIQESCTLKAVAVLGAAVSAIQSLEYTVNEEGPFADGDQVVIYAPAYNKGAFLRKDRSL